MSIDRWREIVNSLQEFAKPEELGFEPLDQYGGERHGSWVWECVKREAEMNRLVMFGVTPLTHRDLFGHSVVSFEAGASTSESFTRLLIEEFPNIDSNELLNGIPAVLAPALIRAMKSALDIKPSDLTSSYPISSKSYFANGM
jgi:hypothetical protein